MIQASEESGIPLSTYHRLESGSNKNPIDQTNFVKAMEWIGVPRKDWWRYMEVELSA